MDIEIPDDVVVLASEPLPNVTIDQLKSELQKHSDEQTLAHIYAGVSNKVGWLMYFWDDDDCTPEIEGKLQRWHEFEKLLRLNIFSILEKETDWVEYRANLKNDGYYWQIMPFMERNGLCGKGGWWIPKAI